MEITAFDLPSQEDSLGIHIVCEEAVPIAVPKKKRKKVNKYEKRRAKARKANQEKLNDDKDKFASEPDSTLNNLHEDNSNAELNDTQPREESLEEVADKDVSKELEEDHLTDLTSDQPEQSATIAASSPPEIDSAEPSDDETSSTTVNEDVLSSPQSSPSPTLAAAVVPSRKVHAGLESTQERAQYMATFHARPHEMDRRSGAVSTIAPSRNSSHLFQGANSFEQLGLHERLQSALTSKLRLEKPTLIQTRAIATLQGDPDCNLFVQSETGSGKTLAYFLPIVQSLAIDATTNEPKQIDRHAGGTRCLIICPTRELASQTLTAVESVCRHSFSWLVPGGLSGGEKRKSEKARLRKGISILVATPGRLLDHLQKTECLLMSLKGKLEWLVLDEADRLLDMGLGSQLEQIVQHIRANQPGSGRKGITWRSILVSATVSKHVQGLAEKMLGEERWRWARASGSDSNTLPIPDSESQIGADSALHLGDSTPRQLGQLHMTVSAKLRLTTLIAFLVQRVQKKERTVVFMSTCDGVDYHHALFSAMDSIFSESESSNSSPGLFGGACSVYRLHGSVPHTERVRILDQFNKDDSLKGRKASLLLATDVAARGLNLRQVDWTVQYDPPCEVADYAHRAGRAARAGKAGHSLLFLLPSERAFLDVLELKGLTSMTALSLTSTLNQAAAICSDVREEGEKRSSGGYGRSKGGRAGEAFCAEIQQRLEDCIMAEDAKAKADAKEKRNNSKATTKRSRRPKEEAVGRLLELARRAYLSYIRSYPTKEKSVKHIFSTRALHLGHTARSFALKEPPGSVVSKPRPHDSHSMDNVDEGNKRNASLAFREARTDEEIAAAIFTKRAESSSRVNPIVEEPTRNNSKKARQMFLAQAARLEQGGMDSF